MNEILSIPAQEYFARGGVSRSMLDVIYNECPAKLKARMDAREDVETQALEFGRLFHRYVLEPSTLKDAFWITPDFLLVAPERLPKLTEPVRMPEHDAGDKLAIAWNARLGEAKKWSAEHSDRPIVKASDVATITGMVESLHSHEQFMRLFMSGESEQSLFAMDDSGTLRKCRMDRLHRKGSYILDLKSCQSAKESRFSKAINDYGLYRQSAYYLDLCNRCGLRKDRFIFVAVEKDPPYIVELYDLDPAAIALGDAENEAALATYRECVKTGIWPAYSDHSAEPRSITLPGFREQALQSYQ